MSWAATRYGALLPVTRRSRTVGRAYAAVVAAVELRLDRGRRLVAERRIARWLDASPDQSRRIYRASLRSEALEEADTSFFMAHPEGLATAFAPTGDEPHDAEPTIYAILHFGSPILTYLHLCRSRGVPVHAIARDLDAGNPMAGAKRRWGLRKVAWVHACAGRPFLGVDGAAIVRAREHLLAGRSLYAALDVPADVVGRHAAVTVRGERLAFAAGVPTLAALTRTPLQPVLAISHRTHLALHWGRRVTPTTPAETLGAIADELFAFVVRHPGEWWLWPYVTPAA